jgi:hypothetical protein
MKYFKDRDGDIFRQFSEDGDLYLYDSEQGYWEYEGMMADEQIGWFWNTLINEYGPLQEITEKEVFIKIL